MRSGRKGFETKWGGGVEWSGVEWLKEEGVELS